MRKISAGLMENEVITQREITRLKKRRDLLLNTACNRLEWMDILAEVKQINEKLRVLHMKLGQQRLAAE